MSFFQAVADGTWRSFKQAKRSRGGGTNDSIQNVKLVLKNIIEIDNPRLFVSEINRGLESFDIQSNLLSSYNQIREALITSNEQTKGIIIERAAAELFGDESYNATEIYRAIQAHAIDILDLQIVDGDDIDELTHNLKKVRFGQGTKRPRPDDDSEEYRKRAHMPVDHTRTRIEVAEGASVCSRCGGVPLTYGPCNLSPYLESRTINNIRCCCSK